MLKNTWRPPKLTCRHGGLQTKSTQKFREIIFLEPKLGGKSPHFPAFSWKMERGRAGECQPSPPSEPQKGTKVWASLQELPRLLASSGGGFGGNLTGNTTPPKMPVLNDGSLRFFSPLVFFWGMQNIGFSRKCPDVFVFFGSTCQKFWKQKAAENSEKL